MSTADVHAGVAIKDGRIGALETEMFEGGGCGEVGDEGTDD